MPDREDKMKQRPEGHYLTLEEYKREVKYRPYKEKGEKALKLIVKFTSETGAASRRFVVWVWPHLKKASIVTTKAGFKFLKGVLSGLHNVLKEQAARRAAQEKELNQKNKRIRR